MTENEIFEKIKNTPDISLDYKKTPETQNFGQRLSF